jgi:hypothetical protein
MNSFKTLKHEVPETDDFKPRSNFDRLGKYAGHLLIGLLVSLWPVIKHFVNGAGETVGYIDPNIWLLILISLFTFMIVIGLCWWLLQQFWLSLGLPKLESMVLQFKDFALWQQLGFYWLCFASLVLAAVGVLTAVL